MAQLVKTIAEVQEYIRVGNGLDIKTLLPALNEVEMQDLVFYLGNDLLAEIIAQKNINTYSPRIAKIAPYVIAAHACLAVWKAGPEIEILVSDNGMLRQETTTEKTAFGGQVKRFRDVAADRGFKAVDQFLAILEKYTQDYPEWLESGYYEQKKGLLIRSAMEFEAAGESLNGSALTFQSLRTIIRDIQEQTIKQVLPDAFFQEILTGLDEDDLSEDNKFILNNYLAPAIAKLALEEALTTLPVEISHSGVNVNQLELVSDARTSKTPPLALIEKKAWGLRGRGQFYLSNMKEYLNTHATSTRFPLWFQSEYFNKTLKAQIQEESLLPTERRVYRA